MSYKPTVILARERGLIECPICFQPYVFTSNEFNHHKQSPSRDHILPKERYTQETYILVNTKQINNITIMCSECNEKRGHFNHCIAALILHRFTEGDDRFYTKYNERKTQ